jgi:hypothetical protein
LISSISYAQSGKRPAVAVIITKPPETILVLCSDVAETGPWLFFDSHGNEADVPQKAFVRQMSSIQMVTSALWKKFPVVEGLQNDGSFQMQKLNTFEAHPVVFNHSNTTVTNQRASHPKPNLDSGNNGCFAKANLLCVSQTVKTDSINREEQKTGAPFLINEDLVRDPTLGELFVDPVFCDKGHTHERSVIEAHFKARQEMKRSNDIFQALGENHGNDCGANMSNYDPTCPYTGEPVSDILIPNEHCNRLLPILLESGAVTLEDGELEAWKAKRQNVERLKKQNKEKKMISSEDVTAVVSSQSGSAQTPTLPCADTVYITGPLLEREELDLGLAVALCPKSCPSPHPAGAGTSPQLRCHNACCRHQIEEPGDSVSCSRCVRLHCQDCITFYVVDTSITSNERSAVCPDCVFQICDVLADKAMTSSPEAERVRQIDSLMEKFFNKIQQRHKNLQDQIQHFEKHQDLIGFRHQIENKLSLLKQTKVSVQQSICQAKEKAEIARQDKQVGDMEECVQESTHQVELNTTLEVLQSQYESIDWTNKASVVRGSEIEHEYNEAMERFIKLAAESSEINDNDAAINLKETASTGCNGIEIMRRLQLQVTELETQQAHLLERGPKNDQDIDYAIELSRIADQHNALSIDLVRRKEQAEKVQQSVQESSISTGKVATIFTRVFRGMKKSHQEWNCHHNHPQIRCVKTLSQLCLNQTYPPILW